MVGMEMGIAPRDTLGRTPASLLRAAQGSLLSSLAYSSAVEAVVSAAKRGIAGSEWRDATVRLLQSRSNSPLSLLWAFLAFHKSSLDREGGSDSLISVAQSLLHSLKFMTAGFCGGPTAIAAAAPIVQILISSLTKDAGLIQKKKWRKVLFELSGFISLCHYKEAPVTHGLFKAPSGSLGLNIWLSEESDFSFLFPFATQLKADGFLNSIESVLRLGEIVETEMALLRLIVEIVLNRSSPSNNEELERKLRLDMILYSKFLCSSGVVLDMLLDAPLKLGGILDDKEEMLLRTVFCEMAVTTVPNSEIVDDIDGLSAGDMAGKESVLFLKRVIIARQLAAEFRSRNEFLRASDLLAGLHRRGAPASLGEWLGDRSSLRLLISTNVLEKPQALLDWLLKASNADFNTVLEKSYIERPKTERVEDLEETREPDSSLFFIGTFKDYGKASIEFDADQAYLLAAGDMLVATKEDVLFDRSEQLERKRTRGNAAGRSAAKKMKQKEGSNGAEVAAGKDVTDSDDMPTSEEEVSEMSE